MNLLIIAFVTMVVCAGVFLLIDIARYASNTKITRAENEDEQR